MSDLRLRRRPNSKTLEKVPDYCRRVKSEVRSQKKVKKWMSDLKNIQRIDVGSQKIMKKMMSDLKKLDF